MKLEICANSLQSAISAEKAGAQRIELCSSLEIGGLTPSYGLIKQVLKNVNIPVNVLIRPRAGNFIYSENEISIIEDDISICKQLGAHGVVCGFLSPNHTIDFELCKHIINLVHPMHFTFHRAFDLTEKPFEALEDLIKLQADSILTSGTEINAVDGLEMLQKLKTHANNRIEIMPGSGINSDNINLFKEAKFSIVHSSASTTLEPDLDSNLFGPQTRTVSDVSKIQAMLKLIS